MRALNEDNRTPIGKPPQAPTSTSGLRKTVSGMRMKNRRCLLRGDGGREGGLSEETIGLAKGSAPKKDWSRLFTPP